MDLTKAAARVAEEIDLLLTQPSATVNEQPLNRVLRGHYHALEQQLSYRSLLSQYRLLNGKQQFDDQQLNAEAQRALLFFDRLLIHIAPQDNDSEKVARNITAELASYGLRSSDRQENTTLQLSMHSQRRTIKRNDAYYCRIKIDAALSANKHNLSATSHSTKAVSGDLEIACQKAAAKLSALVAKDIMNTFWITLKSPSPQKN